MMLCDVSRLACSAAVSQVSGPRMTCAREHMTSRSRRLGGPSSPGPSSLHVAADGAKGGRGERRLLVVRMCECGALTRWLWVRHGSGTGFVVRDAPRTHLPVVRMRGGCRSGALTHSLSDQQQAAHLLLPRSGGHLGRRGRVSWESERGAAVDAAGRTVVGRRRGLSALRILWRG